MDEGIDTYEHGEELVRLWTREGVAYAYLRMYADAEVAILCAMRALFKHVKGSKVFNDPLFADIWCNLQKLYQSRIYTDGSSGIRELEVDVLLWAMVDAAKCFDDARSCRAHLLMARFVSSPHRAGDALKKAFSSDCVASFQEEVLSWKRAGKSVTHANPTFYPELPSRKKWREGKRTRQRNEIAKICHRSLCATPGCECWNDEKLMKCTSCKSVKYWYVKAIALYDRHAAFN